MSMIFKKKICNKITDIIIGKKTIETDNLLGIA